MNVKTSETALRDYLLANDETYRELAAKHKRYGARLKELLSRPYPSEEELIEETILKRKRLLIREQMDAIVARRKGATTETEPMRGQSSGINEINSLPSVLSAGTEPVREEALNDEALGDLDIRLVPPPMLMRKIKVKLNFVGNEGPRISYDPEND